MTRNSRLALICLGAVVVMVGAAFAAVPLYRMFCQVTGFNGTVSRADVAPGEVLDQTMTIRFDSNVRGLPWEFEPEQVRQTVRIGATGMAYFRVTNTSDQVLSGTAAYNVVPERAGPYFQKLECFCFEAQTLQPGQTIEFPVLYFVAPEAATDREARGIREITLSYTFFPTEGFEQASNASTLGGEGQARL